MSFFSYLDLVSDALSEAGVSVANATDYLVDLATDYAAALAACPYYPERASEARADLSACLEVTLGARPARFRAMTRDFGRRALPARSETA
jgi:hypothetical protein